MYLPNKMHKSTLTAPVYVFVLTQSYRLNENQIRSDILISERVKG